MNRPVFQNFKVKSHQFLVHDVHPVRDGIVLKKQDSIQKFVSTFGDHVLLQFIKKQNVLLCYDVCTLFHLPSFSEKTHANTLLEYFMNFFGHRQSCISIQCIAFCLIVIYNIDPSFIHSYETVHKSHRIPLKVALNAL